MLILPTKGKWFRMILDRVKLEEYREIKPYYTKRFRTIGLLDAYGLPTVNKVNVMFRNGYSGNAPYFLANVSLDIKIGREEWGAESGKEYYALRIHEICEGNCR
ncbi:MAG: ASCH domain-containing protein [Lachnospiraceae bacterium]|nr:ASCH domain-containing protein [Lachnospiraceae bacterium]